MIPIFNVKKMQMFYASIIKFNYYSQYIVLLLKSCHVFSIILSSSAIMSMFIFSNNLEFERAFFNHKCPFGLVCYVILLIITL